MKHPFSPGDTSHLPPMGDGYRRWLIRYGVHTAVKLCRSQGACTLAEIQEIAWLDGLLDGFDRRGDTWLAEVLIYGPLERSDGHTLKLTGPFYSDDFPVPKAPAVNDAAWRLPESAPARKAVSAPAAAPTSAGDCCPLGDCVLDSGHAGPCSSGARAKRRSRK